MGCGLCKLGLKFLQTLEHNETISSRRLAADLYIARSSSQIAGGEKRRCPTELNSSQVLDCDIPGRILLAGMGFFSDSGLLDFDIVFKLK